MPFLKTPKESARGTDHFVMGITVESAAGRLPCFRLHHARDLTLN
jgi:hypothetical protein